MVYNTEFERLKIFISNRYYKVFPDLHIINIWEGLLQPLFVISTGSVSVGVKLSSSSSQVWSQVVFSCVSFSTIKTVHEPKWRA